MTENSRLERDVTQLPAAHGNAAAAATIERQRLQPACIRHKGANKQKENRLLHAAAHIIEERIAT